MVYSNRAWSLCDIGIVQLYVTKSWNHLLHRFIVSSLHHFIDSSNQCQVAPFERTMKVSFECSWANLTLGLPLPGLLLKDLPVKSIQVWDKLSRSLPRYYVASPPRCAPGFRHPSKAFVWHSPHDLMGFTLLVGRSVGKSRKDTLKQGQLELHMWETYLIRRPLWLGNTCNISIASSRTILPICLFNLFHSCKRWLHSTPSSAGLSASWC